jgi:hypothetical protein
VQRYLPVATVIVGVLLVIAGGWLLSGHQLRIPVPAAVSDRRWAPSVRLWSMLGYGVAYAVASLSCTVGPFLAVTSAASSGSIRDAVIVYLAYAAGFGLVVTTLAMAAAFASTAVTTQLRRLLPVINRIGGALVLVIGLYVAYYGYYELRLFAGAASAQNPVIGAAGRLQGAAAGWVHAHGGWPWLAALIPLAVCAVAWAVRRRLGEQPLRR